MQSSQRADPTTLQRATQLTEVDKIVSAFEISAQDVQKVANHFVRQMRDGLQDSSLPYQLPAYVTKVPDGSEKGKFLSVDLGGSNCRICSVDLHGEGKLSVSQTKHAVPAELMVNSRYAPLFTWVAERISEFLQGCKMGEEPNAYCSRTDSQQRTGMRIPLGFTFSFTCEQLSLKSGKLLNWDKGWDIPEAIGRDPCAMLQEAVDELGLAVEISALANDSVGTLLARAYASALKKSPGSVTTASATLAGVIIGTGTNAAYVEKLANVSRLEPAVDISGTTKLMLINTEWGSFDDRMEVLPRTTFDDDLDIQSTDPGAQMLEKRVSGMYIAELFRLVVLQLVQMTEPRILDLTLKEDSVVFGRDGVDCALLSLLADDNLDVEVKRSEFSKALGAQHVSIGDIEFLQRIAAAIGRRAARLAGAALAAVIAQSGRLERRGIGSTFPPTDKTQLEKTTAAFQPPECDSSQGSKDIVERTATCGLPLCDSWRWLFRRLRAFSMTAESPLTDDDVPSFPQPEEATRGEEGFGVIDIGVDGSVIEFFPDFEKNMRAALRDVLEIGVAGEERVRIGVTQFGSAVGAALMAQAAIEQDESGQ